MRVKPVMLAAVATMMFLSGCSGQSQVDSSASPVSPSAGPTVSASPETPAEVIIYFVGDTSRGPRLYTETVVINAGSDLGQSALAYIMMGTTQPTDADYTNLWGNESIINSVTYSGDNATVDLTLKPLNVGAAMEMSAIDQLVWTLTENHAGINAVRFTSGGKAIETFAGHVDTTATFKREPNYEVLAPLWIDEVSTPLRNPVTMTGTACTFEAAFGWEVKQGNDVKQSGAGSAAAACPERSLWSVALADLKPGDYTFVVTDYSAEDGSVIQQDTKSFSVS